MDTNTHGQAKALDIPTDSAQLDGIRRAVFRASGVRPALKTRQYAEQIARNYPETVAVVERYLDRRKFFDLSNELVLAPFDVLRQACFYLPWALLEEDDVPSGIKCQVAYNSLLDQIKAFDKTLLQVYRLEAEDEDAWAAWEVLKGSFRTYFATIPERERVGLYL